MKEIPDEPQKDSPIVVDQAPVPIRRRGRKKRPKPSENESQENVTGENKNSKKIIRKKRPRPVQFKIADKETAEKIIQGFKRPEPELKGKTYILDGGRLVLKSEKIYICDEPNCNSYFANETSLKTHMTKHLRRDLKCECCGMIFKTVEEKTEHEDEFHPNLEDNPEANTLKCKKCGKISKDKKALYRHVRESHRKQPYPCLICHFPFTRPENLKDHMKRLHPTKLNPPNISECEICERTFNTRPQWRKHILEFHRQLKSYRCVICNTLHWTKMSYEAHMKTRHLNLQYHHCAICDYSCITRSSYVKHVNTMKHKELAKKMKLSGLEYVKCKSFKNHPKPPVMTKTLQELKELSKEELLDHCWKRVPKIMLFRVDTIVVTKGSTALKHDPAKVEQMAKRSIYLKCVYCDQSFAEIGDVESHEKVCYEDKRNTRNHPCEICGRIFEKPFQLRDHSRVHSGERPFKCSYCDSSFSTKTVRINHEKNAHFGISNFVKSAVRIKCIFEGCEDDFASDKIMKAHYAREHLNIRHRCEKCDNIYAERKSLLRHIKREHTDSCPIRLECKPCKRTYKDRMTYLQHLKRPRHERLLKTYNRKKGRNKEPLN